MKQHINKENLSELAPEQQEKLREWWKPEEGDHFLILGEYEGTVKGCNNDKIEDYVSPTYDDYIEYDEWMKSDCLPLLSIGMMIELLRNKAEWDTDGGLEIVCQTDPSLTISWNEEVYPELADCLWGAIKSIL